MQQDDPNAAPKSDQAPDIAPDQITDAPGGVPGGEAPAGDAAAEGTTAQKPKSRRTAQKNGPWEWNWHPADPQPIRSVSPADLSPEQRERLESSVGGLSDTRQGRTDKPREG